VPLRGWFGLALMLTVLPVLPAAATPRGIAPPHDTLMATRRSEPSIAVNPSRPDNLLITTNATYDPTRRHYHPPFLFASSDGGRHWRGQPLPLPAPFGTGADTSVGFDAAGTAYIGLLGENYNRFCRVSEGSTAVLVTRTSDGGRTPQPPVIVDISPAGATDDKPLLAVAASGPHVGSPPLVVVAWTRWFDAGGSAIMVSRSPDGGRAWSRPLALFRSATAANMGAVPLIGPRGETYVLWAHYGDRFLDNAPQAWRALLRRSTDGGRAFGPTRRLPLSRSLPQLLTPGHLRILPLPAEALDPLRGALYVAWAQARPLPAAEQATTLEANEPSTVDADIVLSRSRDHGATWSGPLIINDTPRGDRFQPALAVAPGGLLAILFYDRRADHGGFMPSLVLAHDQGRTLLVSPTQALAAQPSQPFRLTYFQRVTNCIEEGRFVGDYNGVAANPARGRIVATWGDNERGGWEQPDIRFGVVKATATPAGGLRRLAWPPAHR